MADGIVNTMGFDCNDAIMALQKMDAAMARIENNFGTMASAMSSWNSSAQATVNVLKEIATYAGNAASAMSKLNNAMNKGGAAAQAPPPPPPPQKPELWLPPGVKEEYAKIGAAGQQAGQQVAAGGKTASVALEEAKGSAGRLTMSFSMLSRVVITQAVVRAISGIRDAMHEALSSQVEFQTHMSELNSLFDKPTQSMDQMSEAIAKLSKEFNFPLAQVVEAEYQAVSAQFVSAAQRADVMTASMKLAKVGCMELSTATSLITATLNAYGMSSGQADTVAGKFFQTVRDGKVRGEELAASLGKVMPVAAELGVDINEVTTAIVQLTVAGVKAPEAATSLRSALMALIKPSQDLSKELHNLGYNSGEQLIAGIGLIGALNLLRESTDQTIASAVKMIPNVRAQNTVLRETGENAAKAARELQTMRAAGAESLNKAFHIFIDTDAEKAKAELNKLSVWLTTDFGKTLLSAISGVLQMTGGVNTLTAAISGCAAPLAAGASLFVAYKVAAGAMAMYATQAAAAMAAEAASATAVATCMTAAEMAEARLAATTATLNTVLGTTAAVVGGAVAIWATFGFAVSKLRNELESARSDYNKTMDEMIAKNDAAHREITGRKDQANGQLIQRSVQAAAEINKIYFKEIEDAKTANQTRIDDTKSGMEAMISVKERGYHILKDVAREAEKEIEDSTKRTAADKAMMEDTSFKFAQEKEFKEYNPEQHHDSKNDWLYHKQQQQDEGMASKLAREGGIKLSNARSPEEEGEAQTYFKRAEAYAQMAKSAADKQNDTRAEEEAEGTLLGIVRQRMDAEGHLRQLKERQAQAAAGAAAKEKQVADKMRDYMKEYLKDSQMFDAKGNPLDEKTRAEHMVKSNKDLENFQGELQKSGTIDASKLLDFAALRNKLRDATKEGITDLQIHNVSVAPEALAKIKEQIDGSMGNLQLLKQFAPDMDFTKIDSTQWFEAVLKHLEDCRSKAKEFRDTLDDKAKESDNLKKLQGDVQATIETGHIGKEDNLRLAAQAASGATMPVARSLMTKEEKEQSYPTKVNAAIDKLQQDMKFYADRPANMTPEVIKELGERAKKIEKSPVAYSGDIKRDQDLLKLLRDIAAEKDLINQKSTTADWLKGGAAQAQGVLDKQPQNAVTSAADLAKKAGEFTQLMHANNNGMPELKTDLNAANATMAQMARNAQAMEAATAAAAADAQRIANTPTGQSNRELEAAGGMKNDDSGKTGAQQSQASGGMMWSFLADGGQPRGTDTTHAMLTPGEMVMNAATTRKFGAQLQSMNAGGSPSYHSHGGSVTSVGDISVHINNNGAVGAGTGRQIATELRRELRRGSSSLD
jgi:TP901 family phage tail tape measure protein